VVIRHVAAIGIYDGCGEAYFDEDTARAVLAQVPPRKGGGVFILDYAAGRGRRSPTDALTRIPGSHSPILALLGRFAHHADHQLPEALRGFQAALREQTLGTIRLVPRRPRLPGRQTISCSGRIPCPGGAGAAPVHAATAGLMTRAAGRGFRLVRAPASRPRPSWPAS
jgi:hypothetical protein